MCVYIFYDSIVFVEYSRVQQEFARSLSQFRFQTIGTEQTEDELQIGENGKVLVERGGVWELH